IWRATRRKSFSSCRYKLPNSAPQIRVAFSRIVLKTGFKSPGDELITLRTSEAAESCSKASSRSRPSCATSVFWPPSEELPRATGALRRFGIALRLRALASLLLALERRRIAHPKGLGPRRFSKEITAGICGRRNGVSGSFCAAAILSRSCPLWVKSRHFGMSDRCPLYPQKRTFLTSCDFTPLCLANRDSLKGLKCRPAAGGRHCGPTLRACFRVLA